MSLVIGLKGRAETVVTDQNTAAAAGSGLVPVFATPWMVALMEHAAVGATAASLRVRAPWGPAWTSLTTPPLPSA